MEKKAVNLATKRPEALVTDFVVRGTALRDRTEKVEGMRALFIPALTEYFRAIRIEFGRLTQGELAEMLEVDTSYISKIESGQMVPSDRLIWTLLELVKSERGA